MDINETMNHFSEFRDKHSTGAYKVKFRVKKGQFALELYKCYKLPIIGKVAHGKPVHTIDISISQLSFAHSLYMSSFKAENTFGRENKINFAEYKAYVMHGFMENATHSPMDLMHACIGMSGELGEVHDAIKKYVFHGKPLDKIKIIEETGDFVWYFAVFLSLMDISFADVLVANKIKLDSRYKDGRRDLMFRNTKVEYELMDEALNGNGQSNNHK